jgi:hypothetical protein
VDKTDVKLESAAQIEDSSKWNAGLRLGIMEGVMTRTEGLGAAGAEWSCGWWSGREVRSGRKAWRVRIGVKRRVFRRSERVEGERVAIGEEGYVMLGRRMRERKVRWCGRAP